MYYVYMTFYGWFNMWLLGLDWNLKEKPKE